jgi:hypothetical protein
MAGCGEVYSGNAMYSTRAYLVPGYAVGQRTVPTMFPLHSCIPPFYKTRYVVYIVQKAAHILGFRPSIQVHTAK